MLWELTIWSLMVFPSSSTVRIFWLKIVMCVCMCVSVSVCVCVCVCVCVIWEGGKGKGISKNILLQPKHIKTHLRYTITQHSHVHSRSFSISTLKFTKLYHSAKNWVDSNTSIVLTYQYTGRSIQIEYPFKKYVHKLTLHNSLDKLENTQICITAWAEENIISL